MVEVMEREPFMTPTIVRRVGEGGIQVLERLVEGTPDGDVVKALCVFWSVEHARRDMYANGCYPEDGWGAIGRDHEELALVFDVLSRLDGGVERLAFLEPCPGAPELSAVLWPAELIAMLKESEASPGEEQEED